MKPEQMEKATEVVIFLKDKTVPEYIWPLVSITEKGAKLIINNGRHDYDFPLDEIDWIEFKKV